VNKVFAAALPFFLALFLLAAAPSAGFGQPDPARVKTELKKILEELDREGKPQAETAADTNNDLFSALNAFFRDFGPALIVVLIAVFCLILFIVIRRMLPSFRGVGKISGGTATPDSPVDAGEKTTGNAQGLYREAVQAARGGDYGRAVLLLHRASVAALTDRSLIRGGDEYTNNEIRSILTRGNPCYPAFSAIASASERIAFRYDPVEPAEYERLLSAYDNQFTGDAR
jgi:hypothetical protein